MATLLNLIDAHYAGMQSHDAELAPSPFADDVAVELPSGPLSESAALGGVVQAVITAFPISARRDAVGR